MTTRKIEVRLPIDAIDRLDQEAADRKVSRSELAREKILNTAIQGHNLSPVDYNKLVQVVRRRIGFGIDPRQVEQTVAVVIKELAA